MDENHHSGASCTGRLGSRPVLTLLAVAIFLALPVRLYLATTATMLSRDGVTFTWYAQHLAEDPVAEMKQQDQHPLYPAMILAAHECVEHVGGVFRPWSASVGAVLDDPVRSWTLAGMSVTLLGGLAVVCAVHVLTSQVFNRRAGLLAAVLAALTAEFCQLSADALTDMPHLALYLFALCAALRGLFPAHHGLCSPLTREGGRGLCGEQEARPPTVGPTGCPTSADVGVTRLVSAVPWLFIAGGLSGLAYLMRPEGAGAAVAAVAGAVALARHWCLPRRLGAALVVTLAAALVASPYMLVTGKLVQKKSIFRFFNSDSGAARAINAPGFWVRGRDDGAIDAPKGRFESSHGWSEAATTSSAALHWWLLSPGPFGADDRASDVACAILSPSEMTLSSSGPSFVLAASGSTNPIKSGGLIIEHWGRALRVTMLLPAIAWIFLRRRFPARAAAARLLAAAGALHIFVLFALIRGFDYADQFSVRHTMILAGLSLPFTAAGLTAILDLLPDGRRTIAGILIVLGLVAPTTPWMFEPRNAADVHLRRAGEWVRSQQPAGAKIQTIQHPVAFYANGVCQWCPRDGQAANVLTEARAHRPEWLVFDLQRALKSCPSFVADLDAAAQPGELTLVHVEQHYAKGRLQQALVYRYRPPP